MKVFKKNKSLFSQIFITFVGSLSLLVILLTVIFYFGIRISLEDWNFHSGRRLQNIILPALTQLFRQEGELREHSVYSTLSPFLTVNMYMYVFDRNKKPVFFFVKGERISLQDHARVNQEIGKIGGNRRTMRAVVNEGDIIGYLSVGTFGFTYNLANRQFLQSILLAVLIGMGIAFAISFLFSFIFSKLLSKNTRLVAKGLKQLTEDKRNFHFPTRGARELIDIAQAAQMLSDRLHEESELRKKWVQDISHDLRTPITALKMQFENMVEGVSKISKERVSSLFGEVTKIEKLIQDSFQLIKMETPEMEINCREIDGEMFASTLHGSFRHYEKEKGVRFSMENEADGFRGDETLLSRALSNILQNAFQHVYPGGEVVLRIYRDGDSIVFSVRNTGHVREDEVPKLFERMYRGENSRSTPGSGLGLTITRAICRLHQGTVEIRQESDTTVVDMIIPVHRETGIQSRR